jgi:hypothetical protein
VRNLDLSSYLLAPSECLSFRATFGDLWYLCNLVQRITRYPLLLKQVCKFSSIKFCRELIIFLIAFIRFCSIPKSERNMKLLSRLLIWLRGSLTISTRPFGIRKVLTRSKRYRSTFGLERGTLLPISNVPANKRNIFSDGLI